MAEFIKEVDFDVEDELDLLDLLEEEENREAREYDKENEEGEENDFEDDEENEFRDEKNHWRKLWSFHQKIENESDGTADNEKLIQQRCMDEDIEIISPIEGNLDQFLDEVILLLTENYVEDPFGVFTFLYTPDHIKWIMLPVLDHLDLLIGLRHRQTGLLIGFIAATPISLHVENKELRPTALVDFVCVHRSHRGKRFCPFLYQILGHRLKSKNIEIMVKTSGSDLKYPLARPSYHHLILNDERCCLSGFSHPSVPRTSVYRQNIDEFADSFVPLHERHLESTLSLLQEEAKKSKIGLYFPSTAFLSHFFLRFPNIVRAFVRENPEDSNEVTDFVSVFFLPHKINAPGTPLHDDYLRICYSFYSAGRTLSSHQLLQMIAVLAADELQIDALNILPIGPISKSDCRLIEAGRGTGILNYYITSTAGIHQYLYPEEIFIFPGV
jgi:glycylpeptide N-tetradecanoyltransferase